MSEFPYIGQIQTFGFDFAPVGWSTCDGQIILVKQNNTLFNLIGFAYGGDGSSSFALPDLRGRVPIHKGTGQSLPPYVIGQSAGANEVTLRTANLPPHTHTLNATTEPAGSSTPSANDIFAKAKGFDSASNDITVHVYAPPPATTALHSSSIGVTGLNDPVPIMQPYLTINFCMALYGTFPQPPRL